MSESSIRILDETVANQIAAGEVVERPASIVKELIENAIDAAAHSIKIEIADGGTSYISVTDDGVGMSNKDARLAVIRHATSKISSADDLARIITLGFRGEALPSIASVSKFSLVTRLQEEDLGTLIEIQGGSMVEARETGANTGTTITVADVFYNTPARRKFLKTPATESGYIHAVIVKLALSRPDIAFKLINNGKLVLSTPGNGSLADTLSSIYGHQILPDILALEHHNEKLRISGYIGKPSLIKSGRQWQTFLINQRVINNRMIAKAIDNAYHSLLPHSGYPLVVLSIELSPGDIDVNIHPQKSEVKFSDEKLIYSSVYRSISDTLTAAKGPQELAATYMSDPKPPAVSYGAASSPVRSAAEYSPSYWRESPMPLEVIRTELKQAEISEASLPDNTVKIPDPEVMLQVLGQVENCYIVARGQDGLYIVDQHAAHERILYDKFQQAIGCIPSQQLLIPLLFQFDTVESEVITESQPVFQELGFVLEPVGPNTFRLTELPADVAVSDVESFVREVLQLIQNMHKPTNAELRHAYLQIASCRAAVKAGDELNIRQAQALLDELCVTTLPYTCPHGRPTMIRFGSGDLAKLFKRT